MMKRKLRLGLLVLGFVPVLSFAQQSARFRPETESSFRSEDALSHSMYSIARINAQDALSRMGENPVSSWPSSFQRQHYISILADLKNGKTHGIDSALTLLGKLPQGALRDRLSLAMGRYYFGQGKLADAIPYYEAAGIVNLSNQEIADAKFELAYSYFNNRQFVAANTLFAVMKEVPGRYYSPGNYYYGLLAYNDGDYEAAQKSFSRIDQEALYKPVVPYYIAELYYFMGKRDKALSTALRLIKSPDKSYYDNELHLLAAQCLFESGRYGDALPYFEHYYENSSKVRKEELYEMGYSYYRVGEWKSAIERFKPLSATQDSLGQTAMYLLGDCYLKGGNKESARNAFGMAASMPYNQGQREAALLLHGKLSYDLGYADDGLKSTESLLRDYPNGKMSAEGHVLQSQIYLQTSNFKEAYEALLDESPSKPEYRALRQRAAFGYAMQETQHLHLPHASDLLSDALNYPASAAYTEAATFWKAELTYRLHQFDSAAQFAQQYLSLRPLPAGTPVVSQAVNREHAQLILGYASLELKDYKQAQTAFSNARAQAGDRPAATATLREADAYFMQKEFDRAQPLYANIMQGRGADADYARLQYALIAGLKGDNVTKKRLLQEILQQNPQSNYANEARYEMGVLQLGLGQYQESISTLAPLAGNSPGPFTTKALLKIGTAQQQLNRDDHALTTYTRVVKESSDNAAKTDALIAIKSIYIERNQPDQYTKFLQENGLSGANDAELDSTYYTAAESQFADNNWAAAATGFRRYLDLYPQGAQAVKARYYLANSLYQQKQYRPAHEEFDSLLSGEWISFSDEAARKAAELSVMDTAWEEALGHYESLAAHTTNDALRQQALTGLMRITLRTGDTTNATYYADSLSTMEGLAPTVKDEANLLIARKSLSEGNTAKADPMLFSLQSSSNGAIAAEARYLATLRLYQQGKFKDAEAAASKNIKQSSGYEYWVIKNYLLLGDILTAEKDYFNARATLQSVAEHASDPALREEAKQKLDALKATENTKLSND
jgi:TolA-binding protein